MKKLLFVIFTLTLTVNVFAQDTKQDKSAKKPVDKTAVKTTDTAEELAKKSVAAHGGDKLKNIKNLVVSGGINVTTSFSAQSFPGTFNMVFAGDKYRLEINSIQAFKQIFDGQQTYSSLGRDFSMPPINKVGLPVLAKIGEQGYTVSELPEKLSKKSGFRVTTPEGYFTDFVLDSKTNQVKEYESAYQISGREVTTSVAIDKYREIDGVLVNEKFAQRFDMGQMTIYAEFKAKDILIDSKLDDDIFVMKG
jgi:hypothetical protein